MNINLHKLSPIQTGANLFNTITADRINAIQDAIKELARGRNIVAGDNIRTIHQNGAVNISAALPQDTTKKRQIQEWNYSADDTDRQISYNGRPDYQPYRDLEGLDIPLPRPDNIFDINCEPFPEKPLNVWDSMKQTYQIGADFMQDEGDHFIFTKPGCYELEFEYTAMHKTSACEWQKNTHSFDLLFYPAIGNKGKSPVWEMYRQRWDWLQGRMFRNTSRSGQLLKVIHPQNAFVQYTLHGKQRLPNDANAIVTLYDEEKNVGLKTKAGIKYLGDCNFTQVEETECAFVLDKGQDEEKDCESSLVSFSIPSFSTSYSSISVCVNSYSLSGSQQSCKISVNVPYYNLTNTNNPTTLSVKVPYYSISTSQGKCSYEWDSLVDPCANIKGNIANWNINTTYNPGEIVNRNGTFFVNTQTTNTTEPTPDDDIFWKETDPCVDEYDVAVCDGEKYERIYLDGNAKSPVSGYITVPTASLISYDKCKGGEFYTFDKFATKPLYYTYNDIAQDTPITTPITGDIEVNVPVGLKKIPYVCSNTVYDYTLGSATNSSFSYVKKITETPKKCPGYQDKVEADITIPVALISEQKTTTYDYPVFGTRDVKCDGTDTTVDINVDTNIPTQIISTSIGKITTYANSDKKINLQSLAQEQDITIPLYEASTHKCDPFTATGININATLDIIDGISESTKEVTAKVDIPDFEDATANIVTSCATFSSEDVVKTITPVTEPYSDTVAGEITVDLPTTIVPTPVTKTVTLPIPQILDATLDIAVLEGNSQKTVVTDVAPYEMMSFVTDVTPVTSSVGDTIDGTIDVDMPTGLTSSTQDVTATVTMDKIADESVTFVTSVSGNNTTITVPSVSVGSKSATACCYIPEE